MPEKPRPKEHIGAEGFNKQGWPRIDPGDASLRGLAQKTAEQLRHGIGADVESLIGVAAPPVFDRWGRLPPRPVADWPSGRNLAET